MTTTTQPSEQSVEVYPSYQDTIDLVSKLSGWNTRKLTHRFPDTQDGKVELAFFLGMFESDEGVRTIGTQSREFQEAKYRRENVKEGENQRMTLEVAQYNRYHQEMIELWGETEDMQWGKTNQDVVFIGSCEKLPNRISRNEIHITSAPPFFEELRRRASIGDQLAARWLGVWLKPNLTEWAKGVGFINDKAYIRFQSAHQVDGMPIIAWCSGQTEHQKTEVVAIAVPKGDLET